MSNTNVYLVCDCSGSMAGALERAMRDLLNNTIGVLAEAERVHRQRYDVELLPFSTSVKAVFPFNVTAGEMYTEVVRANVHTNSPFGGGTALLDAIGLATDKAAKALDGKYCDAALIMVFTDGQENASVVWSRARLRAEIERLERDGRVTITFAGPASSRNFLKDIGVNEGNFRAWDGGEKELRKVDADTKTALDTYTTSRSLGATKADRLYADASQLTPAGIRGNTAEFKCTTTTVSKRMAGRTIADFFGKDFVQGGHFYELVKAEYIQDDKDLVVYIKAQNEYRIGSRSVRALLGLPETGKIRVHPSSNSSPYQLFVRSESTNRKVVEGQAMLTEVVK